MSLSTSRLLLYTPQVVNPPGDCEGSRQVCAAELRALVPPQYTTARRTKADKLLFFTNKFIVVPPKELFEKNEYDQFVSESRHQRRGRESRVQLQPRAERSYPKESNLLSSGLLPFLSK